MFAIEAIFHSFFKIILFPDLSLPVRTFVDVVRKFIPKLQLLPKLIDCCPNFDSFTAGDSCTNRLEAEGVMISEARVEEKS
jgi:hypothetical protein